MKEFVRGAMVKLTETFANDADVSTDPTAVVLYLRTPGGAITFYTYGVDTDVVRVGTGIYRYRFVPTTVGIWGYRWVGTGAVEAVSEGQFLVKKSQFVT